MKSIDVGAIGAANFSRPQPQPGQTAIAGCLETITDAAVHTPPEGCHYYALLAVGSDVVLNASTSFVDGYHRGTKGVSVAVPAGSLTLTKDVARMGMFKSVQRASGGDLWAFIRRNDGIPT